MNTKSDKIFVFDLDGVIADTIGSLYRSYLAFLRAFDIRGTQQEFAHLNGPSLEEIIIRLKQDHRLEPSLDALKEKYLALLDNVYENATPIHHVQKVIASLRARNVTMAIASSAPRAKIERAVERFGLTNSFAAIVSGDDVQRAKPAPDIYNAVKRLFPKHKFYVVEDSLLGMAAAHEAGMEVIFFDAEGREKEPCLYQCGSMDEVSEAIDEILSTAETLALARSIQLAFTEHDPFLSLEHRQTIESIWQDEQRRTPTLFNGTVTSYRAHSLEGDVLAIQCFSTEYKCVLAQLRDATLRDLVAPLGVSGIVVDEQGATLIGQRRGGTEYAGWYEFVPSGALDGQVIEDQIRTEFDEESSLGVAVISSIDPFCLIFDRIHNVYDIGCIIRVELGSDAQELKDTKEYAHMQRVQLGELDAVMAARSFVPTSVALLDAFTGFTDMSRTHWQ